LVDVAPVYAFELPEFEERYCEYSFSPGYFLVPMNKS
jgi:hypothetical protein